MATSSLPSSSAANSSVTGPIVLACDSTVTAANGAASSARRGTSSRGTAWRSKKLLALYSFSRSGTVPASDSRTSDTCSGSAPAGVGPSSVQRHRSQNEQVKGHSAPARNTVSARSTPPLEERSSSRTVPCAFQGSTAGFGRPRSRIRASGVECVEMAAITGLILGEQAGGRGGCRRAVLEAALGIDRHVDAEDRSHAPSHDLALQPIETLMRALRQLGEGNRFGDTDDGRPRVGTESDKAVAARAGIAADAAATVAAGVGERVLERVDAPAFLIKHAIVHHAADRQLAVRFDRVVLQVLIAAVAIHHQPPSEITRAHFLQQRQVDSRTLHIERLIVLDHLDRPQRVQPAGRHVDRLAEDLETGGAQELARLPRVLARAVERQCERLEARGRLPLV